MHPHKSSGDDHEHQHETALPDPGEIVQYAECQRQDESAEAANHADYTAHCADVHGVVNRNVFVYGGRAQGHEKAEDKDQGYKHGQVHG